MYAFYFDGLVKLISCIERGIKDIVMGWTGNL
jgi:hypothetical protein